MNQDNDKEYLDITIPPKDILRYIILDRRKVLMDSFQEYYNKRYLGASWPTNKIKSNLLIFFDEIYSAMKNDYKNKEIEFRSLMKHVTSNDIDELMTAKRLIDDWLYRKGLLKFDFIEGFDRSNAELSNIKAGF